ncbi:hypothetical protein QBC35DRAFT_510976 [Podospora australis]|uniref:Rhodopsin domain-containing protein n=1 Tax=Podospora australis TaxID=1536484 RepID=A0AAN6X4A3_9PEZI|nr:hypothetical protein QBC35DRAFT_510976 [Podospora australis]
MGLWEVEDYGVVADKACWAMFAVTTVVISLRVYCRALAKNSPGLGVDDYITLFCLLVFLITCILITLGSQHGLGRHLATLDPEDIVPAAKYNVVISSVLIWTFSLPKFAVVSTLQRILSPGTKTLILFWGLAISSQACILATSVWWFKQCDPVEFGWDRSIPGGKCASVNIMKDLGYFTSAYSAFLDVFFAFYPIPFIMRLNMPLRTRVAVSTALGLSALAFVVSVYKLAIFGEIFDMLAVDLTYPVPYLDILGVAEGCILLVCASLPALGPLFRAAKAKMTSYGGSRGTRQITSSTGLEGGKHHTTSQLSRFKSSKGGGGGLGRKSVDGGSETELNAKDYDQEPSLRLRPSFDAIPMITTGNRGNIGSGDNDLEAGGGGGGGGIHRTMEVSVSTSYKS